MAFSKQLHAPVGGFAAGALLFTCLLSSASAQGEPAGQVPAAKPASRATDAIFEQARKTYGVAEWPRGERFQGFALGEFTMPGLTGKEPECLPPAPVQRHFADAQGRDRVRVEFYLEPTAVQAHERVLGWLALRNNPEPAPTAASQGVIVGDVGYAGHSGAGVGRLAWIAFARGNCAFRVLDLAPSITPPIDLGSVAVALDTASRKSPLLAASEAGPALPQITRLVPARDRCIAGEIIPIEVEIKDPAKSRPVVNWIVGGQDQGQGYMEQDAEGRWNLHTTGKGTLTLTLCVVASTGSVASATRNLQID